MILKIAIALCVPLLAGCEQNEAASERDLCIDYGYPMFGLNSLGAIGDADGDGAPDLLFADLGFGDPRCSPLVWLESSKSGANLYRVELPRRDFWRHASLSALGDLNADGVSEWACIESGQERPRLELVFDGRSGKLLREAIVPARDPSKKFVTVLGDLDQDGYPEALVAKSQAHDERKFAIHSLHDGALKAELDLGATALTEVSQSLGLAECGLILFAGPTERDQPLQLIAYNWKSGAQVFAIELPATPRDFLDGLHRLPDIDGDALPDFAVAVAGQVELRASRDGALLSTLAGAHAWELFGRNLVSIPIRDGGLLIAVSAENGGPVSQGRVDVFDSHGRQLHTLEQSSVWHFSAGLVSAGDCDGDGTPDLLIAVDHANSRQTADAWIYKPRTGELLDIYTRLGNSVVRWPRWPRWGRE